MAAEGEKKINKEKRSIFGWNFKLESRKLCILQKNNHFSHIINSSTANSGQLLKKYHPIEVGGAYYKYNKERRKKKEKESMCSN